MACSIARSAIRLQARGFVASTSPVSRSFAPCFVGSFRNFSDIKFTKTHEWLREDGGAVYMGISKFAANALGEVVYADLLLRAPLSAQKTPSALWRVSKL